MNPKIAFRLVFIFAFVLLAFGCGKKNESPADGESKAAESAVVAAANQPAPPPQPAVDEDLIVIPQIFEVEPEALLAAQLAQAQLEQGWVRLFDGQSPFGWSFVGKANWQISDGGLQVSRGERSYFCTSFPLSNYELKVDFRSDPDTNSGIFLRTGLQPEDVATECLELNIAPPDNPFPTGSFVQRKKLEPAELGNFDPTQWHTFHIRLNRNQVQVALDGKQIMQLDDFVAAPTGHISLQHNSGRVEFRNVLLRPVSLIDLKLDENWTQDWTLSEQEPNTFSATVVDDGIKLVGGLGQLQSKREFGNFFLQARYTLAKSEVNTGIFFRCIPGNMLDGYECQVNHAIADGDPLRALDAGAGAIFRRQPARMVVGNGTQPTYITLLANGRHMVTWVNGIQVADFFDTREPDDNPRKGRRTEPGPIALQGHDPTTNVTFHSLKIAPLE